MCINCGCVLCSNNEARMHAQLKRNYSMFDFNHSSALARTFCEAERRLVICIDFTVALALCVGAVGEGDIYIAFIYFLLLIVLRK